MRIGWGLFGDILEPFGIFRRRWKVEPHAELGRRAAETISGHPKFLNTVELLRELKEKCKEHIFTFL